MSKIQYEQDPVSPVFIKDQLIRKEVHLDDINLPSEAGMRNTLEKLICDPAQKLKYQKVVNDLEPVLKVN